MVRGYTTFFLLGQSSRLYLEIIILFYSSKEICMYALPILSPSSCFLSFRQTLEKAIAHLTSHIYSFLYNSVCLIKMTSFLIDMMPFMANTCSIHFALQCYTRAICVSLSTHTHKQNDNAGKQDERK